MVHRLMKDAMNSFHSYEMYKFGLMIVSKQCLLIPYVKLNISTNITIICLILPAYVLKAYLLKIVCCAVLSHVQLFVIT